MPDRLDDFLLHRKPTAERPLMGLTVLVVDDSRFASEAMRLLCLRSGARVRRADSLQSANRHLVTYRPSVLVVDLGLPDGSGLSLISELAAGTPRIPVILATSGDDGAAEAALAAGADGFLAKPLSQLGEFQQAVLDRLPREDHPSGPRAVSKDRIDPDTIALQDDLARVAQVIAGGVDPKTADYLAQFTTGVARSARDTALEEAALELARARTAGRETGAEIRHLAGIVESRLERRAVV